MPYRLPAPPLIGVPRVEYTIESWLFYYFMQVASKMSRADVITNEEGLKHAIEVDLWYDSDGSSEDELMIEECDDEEKFNADNFKVL